MKVVCPCYSLCFACVSSLNSWSMMSAGHRAFQQNTPPWLSPLCSPVSPDILLLILASALHLAASCCVWILLESYPEYSQHRLKFSWLDAPQSLIHMLYVNWPLRFSWQQSLDRIETISYLLLKRFPEPSEWAFILKWIKEPHPLKSCLSCLKIAQLAAAHFHPPLTVTSPSG